jgi:prepilin-type N-terminal cleavage/methylation domain-containing protein
VTSRASPGSTGGFTLIEVLAVVAILVVLATVLIPAVGFVQAQARRTATRQVVTVVTSAMETYRQVHFTLPPVQGPSLPPGQAGRLSTEPGRARGLIDLLIRVADLPLPSDRLAPLDREGFRQLTDAWHAPMFYTLVDPVRSPASAAAHAFWSARGAAMAGISGQEAYPVVYAVAGTDNIATEVGSAAEGAGWWIDPGRLIHRTVGE